MEWVETTGRTLEEAKDAALDELGVDELDAEFEVLAEPKQGLFGRVRGEARVRARVRPTTPRPKADRRDRRRRPRRGATGNGGARLEPAAAPEGTPSGDGAGEGEGEETAAVGVEETSMDEREQQTGADDEERLDDAAEVATEFLDGLVSAFGLSGTVARELGTDGAVELAVEGDDLGVLIGPKGQTLSAVQELARTVVTRQADAGRDVRLRVDVAGYRARRREALARFTRQVAEEVRGSGTSRALEPMAPPDRKVVHDVVNEIDGVRTISEGEEPRRKVVILPDT